MSNWNDNDYDDDDDDQFEITYKGKQYTFHDVQDEDYCYHEGNHLEFITDHVPAKNVDYKWLKDTIEDFISELELYKEYIIPYELKQTEKHGIFRNNKYNFSVEDFYITDGNLKPNQVIEDDDENFDLKKYLYSQIIIKLEKKRYCGKRVRKDYIEENANEEDLDLPCNKKQKLLFI
jgi:hypothetical protein